MNILFRQEKATVLGLDNEFLILFEFSDVFKCLALEWMINYSQVNEGDFNLMLLCGTIRSLEMLASDVNSVCTSIYLNI